MLAKATNTSLFTVRYYTKIGLLTPVRDTSNGYKKYSITDKERLNFIVSSKELGFTLNEIRQILDNAVHGDSPCPMVRSIVEARIRDNKEKIKELKKLQKRLEHAAEMWSGMKDSVPDGHSVCRLIESFADSEHIA